MRNSNIASTALLYQNRTELEQFIQEYCLPARREDSSWLVMIHTSCHTPEGAVAIAKHVSELLPDAKILGTSASAVIYHGSIYEDGCLLIFTRLLHTQVKVQPLSFADKTPGALAEETAGLLTPDSKAMFAFFTDQYMQMQPYLDRLEETGAEIEHLRSIQTALDIALQEEDLTQIREELIQSAEQMHIWRKSNKR